MTVIPLPRHGQWAWDVRGQGRGVRVSAHVHEGLLNLSLWRGGACVGTARLLPVDVAKLVSGLSEGLAEISAQRTGPVDPGETPQLEALEERLAQLEFRLGRPTAVQRAGSVVRSARRAWMSPRNRLFGRVRSGGDRRFPRPEA